MPSDPAYPSGEVQAPAVPGVARGASAPPDLSSARFEALLRHSADILSLLDAEGHLLYNSPAAERISGFSSAELAGVDTFTFMHPDDRAAVAAAFGEVLARPGATVTVQYRYRHKSGAWTWMEAVASNRLDDPDLRGVVAVSRDISERKRAEAERARIEAQLVHTQRLESLGLLAGGFAHHFNNLLLGMRGAADLARAELPSGHPAREHLDTLADAAGRAGALCRQLLTLGGRAGPSRESFSLQALLEEAAELLAVSAGKRVQVRREVAADLPPLVGDPAQLRQALLNLVVNGAEAVEARDGRTGTVSLRARAVDADRALLDGFQLGPERRPGRYVRLEVEDDGVGMGPEVLARLFTPFFSTKFAGRGLGLAATLGVVKGHEGAILVRSSPGRGSTFTVLLPAGPAATPDPAPGPAPGPAPMPGEGAWRGQGCVLLVDDEDVVRRVGRRMLQRLGFEVEEAPDGVAAVAAVRAAPGRFAAVLLDLTMPRLDGLGALAQIRAAAPSLPVILSSGLAAEDVRARAQGLGVSGFAEKPYGLDTLRTLLQRLVG